MISVLYVDDEPDLLDIGKIFLEQSGEFSVTTLTSAPEGLALLQRETFDVIISDYQMPEMDGILFLQEVRARMADLPFILFTGRGREEIVIQAINNGVDFYMQKGGDPKSQFAELAHKIRHSIRSRKAERSLNARITLIQSIAEISTKFIYVPSGAMDDLILHALKEVGKLCSADRSYIIQWDSPAQASASMTHEWNNQGILPEKVNSQHLSLQEIRWFMDPLSQKKIVHIPRLKDIPDIPALGKERLLRQKEQTLIHVPLFTEDTFIGLLGLSSIQKEAVWTEEDIDILKIFSEVITNALVRRRAENELRQSEILYRTIFENNGNPVVIVEEDTTISLVNQKFEKLIGFSRKEIEDKKSWTDFVANPEDLKRMNEYHRLRRINPELAPPVYESRLKDREGIVRDVIISVTMIPGTQQSLLAVVDITDRKEAERAVKESENLYRTVFESTGNASIIIAEDTTIIQANSVWASLTGLPRQEQTGRSWTEFIHPDDVDLMKKHHYQRRIDPTQPPKKYEARLIDVNHTVHDCIIHVDLIPGTTTSIASIVDITDRKRAELAIRESENFYRTLFETTGAATIIIEKDTTISLANSGFARLSGYSKEELEGKRSWTDFVVKEDLERMKKYHYDRRNDPLSAPGIYDFRFIDRYGTIKYCFNNVAVIPGTTKSVASVVDINDRVMAEQDLLKKNEELNAAYEELTVTEEELRQNLAEISKTDQR